VKVSKSIIWFNTSNIQFKTHTQKIRHTMSNNRKLLVGYLQQ